MSFTAKQYEELLEVVDSIYASALDSAESTPTVDSLMRMFEQGAGPTRAVRDVPAWRRPEGFAALVPHLRRASALRARLQRDASGTAPFRIIEFLPTAALIVDADARVVAHNAAAAAALRELEATHSHGALAFAQPQAQAAWQATLASVVQQPQQASLVLTDGQHLRWTLTLTPWSLLAPADRQANSRYLLVLDRRGGPSALQAARVAAGYRLTNAEADVLCMLVRGMNAKDISRRRGSTLNTVRTQIASILEKTRCRTQRELLAKVHATH